MNSVAFAPVDAQHSTSPERTEAMRSASCGQAEAPLPKACMACRASTQSTQLLEKQLEEAKKQLWARYRRESDLQSRVQSLSSLLKSFGERCALQPDLQKELKLLLEGAVPDQPAVLEDLPEVTCDEVAFSDSDTEEIEFDSDEDATAKFEPVQVMDYPLSQTEKVRRVQQLFEWECSAAEQEARRLKRGKSTYKSALRRVSQRASRVHPVAALSPGGDIQDFTQQVKSFEDTLRRRSVAEPEVESPSHFDRRQEAASQEPMALANVAYWTSRPANVLKELLSWGSLPEEEEEALIS
eukprot:CAMPEP_0197654944 /NCGR_PEP_ID=MMETSP1338-20131121/39153_1 /TAXON_ID=43686 ORGANISM="Pelagodinium beii, Strain RCC1491" /NCGR_SAMPLE_ID=MMETSP1338 /ASSEMBLY_ACC=CAM_ASM_000754 /LENGTH=296 /DNA_ID=CAMNT_0043230487 /DNA_START=23 /DNA_END=909 /DNA_ORIENTATION=-